MKYVHFLFKNALLNKSLKIFSVIQLILLIVIVNIAISQFQFIPYLNDYMNFDNAENTYYLSSVIKNNIESYNDYNEFLELVDEIDNIDGVDGVGYYLENSVFLDKQANEYIRGVWHNEALIKHQYSLLEGKWFEDNKSDQLEVILGGDISNKYAVGEKIIISVKLFEEEKVTFKDIEGVVIGKLENPLVSFKLDTGGTAMHIGHMLYKCDDFIITNNDSIIDYNRNTYYPTMSLIVNTNKDTENQELYSQLNYYGIPNTIKEIQDTSTIELESLLKEFVPTGGLLCLAVIVGMLGITYLCIHRNIKTYSIYILYGLNRKKCIRLAIVDNMIIVAIAVFFSLIILKSKFVANEFLLSGKLGIENVIFTGSYIVLILLIIAFILIKLLKNGPLELLRRFE